jgi:hypothetical protein
MEHLRSLGTLDMVHRVGARTDGGRRRRKKVLYCTVQKAKKSTEVRSFNLEKRNRGGYYPFQKKPLEL